jgi:two-component system nitrogen regulation response regulator GlnG/two-component system response regulator HydG
MPGVTTLPVSSDVRSGHGGEGADPGTATVLALAWSAEEPHRVGEIAVILPSGPPQVLGRGEGETDEARLRFCRQRPGALGSGPGLAGAGLSRRQLVLTAQGDGLVVESVGRCELRVNGLVCERAFVRPGDTMYLRRQILLLCTRRAALIPMVRYFPRDSWGDFGEPDAHGILGESPTTWHLRELLAFVAKSATHALLVGESGTGKELAARAIHGLSARASRAFVARNAATLPPGLVDAELFGSARNYPNAGLPERPGLIGQADGGTLFLDEIGELPAEQQAHLLRVLDSGGEYQRLGEATTRRSNFRLIGATNRDPSALKHDVLARLASLIELSPVASRREDIALLARHLLVRAAQQSPEVAGRFVARDSAGRPYACFAPSFIDYVLRQPLPGNTRQLEALLWKGISKATGSEIVAPGEGASQPPAGRAATAAVPTRVVAEPSADDIRSALAAAGGSVGKAARALGVANRFALYRLMKKHGIGGEPSQ